MLIARRLPRREKTHCKVSVECLLVPAKCNRDTTDGVRGISCRKHQALCVSWPKPFCFITGLWGLSADRHPHPILGVADTAQTAPWPQKSRVGKTSWANPKATHTWFQGLWALVSAGRRHQIQGRNSTPPLLPAKSGMRKSWMESGKEPSALGDTEFSFCWWSRKARTVWNITVVFVVTCKFEGGFKAQWLETKWNLSNPDAS